MEVLRAAVTSFGSFMVLFCVACGSVSEPDRGSDAPTKVQTSKGAFELPSPALADGRGLAEGMKVNVWTTPQRSRIACDVPDGEPMVLISARHNADESRYYFEITAMNGCKGWLPETFVREDPDVAGKTR